MTRLLLATLLAALCAGWSWDGASASVLCQEPQVARSPSSGSEFCSGKPFVIVAAPELATSSSATAALETASIPRPRRWYVPAPAYVKANRYAAKCLTRLGADFVQRYDFSAELEAWWPEKYLYVKWTARAGQIYGAVYYAEGEFVYAKIDGCLNRAIAASAPAGLKPDRARVQMLPGDGGGGAGTCEWWQSGWTVYKSPGYMYVFQPDGYYLLVYRYGYATCGWLAQIGNYAWVAT